MQPLRLSVACFVALLLVVPNRSAPLTGLLASNYQYPAPIDPHSQYLPIAGYHDANSPYIVYNILRFPTELNGLPTAVLANGKPALYPAYYGTPVYDFRFPFQTIYPIANPMHPGLPGAGFPGLPAPGLPRPEFPRPTQPPVPTPGPTDDGIDEDGIEKLDEKVDPATEMKQPENSSNIDEDDTVAIDAI